jgi:hypothetical protein
MVISEMNQMTTIITNIMMIKEINSHLQNHVLVYSITIRINIVRCIDRQKNRIEEVDDLAVFLAAIYLSF